MLMLLPRPYVIYALLTPDILLSAACYHCHAATPRRCCRYAVADVIAFRHALLFAMPPLFFFASRHAAAAAT